MRSWNRDNRAEQTRIISVFFFVFPRHRSSRVEQIFKITFLSSPSYPIMWRSFHFISLWHLLRRNADLEHVKKSTTKVFFGLKSFNYNCLLTFGEPQERRFRMLLNRMTRQRRMICKGIRECLIRRKIFTSREITVNYFFLLFFSFKWIFLFGIFGWNWFSSFLRYPSDDRPGDVRWDDGPTRLTSDCNLFASLVWIPLRPTVKFPMKNRMKLSIKPSDCWLIPERS